MNDGRIFSASDLDLETPTGDTSSTSMVGSVSALVKGSVAVKVLHSIFSGNPTTIVQSPPGAGKSTLVATVVKFLLEETELRIHVVAPTNNAALELASKIASMCGPDVALCKKRAAPLPRGVGDLDFFAKLKDAHPHPARQVPVTTVHLAKTIRPAVDVMIVEEAYQTTYGLLAEAADGADQVVLVGDPGQIGPVITHDLSPWRGIPDAPAARAPEVFARLDATVLTLPATYRIGQESVNVIAPLYPFEFTSERIPTSVEGCPELASFRVPTTISPHSLAETMVTHARTFVGLPFTQGATTREITEKDICLIGARNELVSVLGARVSSTGMTCGTADSLQGGQWPVVIAADPLISTRQVSEHALDTGRLCVMTSRHMAHLSWIFAPNWADRLGTANISTTHRLKAQQVREHLEKKALN